MLPHSYSADDTCHLWKAGIPCLLYGPATIRGNADEDDACVLVSEMVKVTRVLAVTALDVCRRDAGRARHHVPTTLKGSSFSGRRGPIAGCRGCGKSAKGQGQGQGSTKEQALVNARREREAMPHQIQQLVHERVRFASTWEYSWPSVVGLRVEEPAPMPINPYPGHRSKRRLKKK